MTLVGEKKCGSEFVSRVVEETVTSRFLLPNLREFFGTSGGL